MFKCENTIWFLCRWSVAPCCNRASDQRNDKRQPKKRDRRFAISRFPGGHRGIQNLYLRQCNIKVGGHFCSLNTVWKTIFLKRSSAAGPRSTFIRRIAPSQEARRNSERSTGSNVESISPMVWASAMHEANGARHSSKIASSLWRKSSLWEVVSILK